MQRLKICEPHERVPIGLERSDRISNAEVLPVT